MKICIRSTDGAIEGPFEAHEVLDSFLKGMISFEAMIRLEDNSTAWIPIFRVFEKGISLDASLQRLARYRSNNKLNSWLRLAAWIFVTTCVVCIVALIGFAAVMRELVKEPSWNEYKIAPVRKVERQAREIRLKKLTREYDKITYQLQLAKQKEMQCHELFTKMKKTEEDLKRFEDLGTNVVHYHFEGVLGAMDVEKLRVLEADALTLPSPWLIYFEIAGLELYFADYHALKLEFRNRETAYRNALTAYDKAGVVEFWGKKKEYLDLQIEAVQSVLD